MKFFRIGYFREVLIILTGVTFLNMGFISAEISFFHLDYSVADEISSSLEDEQESGSESQANDSSEEEIDLMHPFFHDRLLSVSFTALRRESSFIPEMVGSTHRETFSPPPETISMLA